MTTGAAREFRFDTVSGRNCGRVCRAGSYPWATVPLATPTNCFPPDGRGADSRTKIGPSASTVNKKHYYWCRTTPSYTMDSVVGHLWTSSEKRREQAQLR